MRSRGPGWHKVTAGVAGVPLVLIVFANSVDQLTSSAYQTLLPEIRHHFHLSLADIGIILAIAGPIALAVNLPLGWLGDRRRRTRIAAVGTLLGAVSSAVIGVAASVPMLVTGLVGSTLGADGEVTHRSLLADYYPLAIRARVFAIYDVGEYASAALAPLIAGGLALGLGWRAVFLIAVLPAVAVAAGLSRLPDPRRGETDRVGIGLSADLAVTEDSPAGWLETFRTLGRLRAARLIYPAIAFATAASAGYGVTIATFWQDNYHLGPFGRGAAAAAAAATGAGGALFVATVAQRRLAKRGPREFIVLIGVAELVSAAVTIPMVTWHWLPGALTWNCLNIGADAITETGAVVIAAMVIPARMRTLGLATGSAWALLGLAAGPLFGLLADQHGSAVGLGLTAIPSAIEGLLLLALIPIISSELRRAAARETLVAQLRADRAVAAEPPVLSARSVIVDDPGGRRIDGIDLDVGVGEAIVLTGGNGAGKSTLLQVLCGLIVPDEGVVTVEGVSLSGDAAAAVRSGLVYAPGATSLFDELTVLQHLELASWTDKAGRRRRPEPMSASLQARQDVRAGELSGGERQLLNLEMALAVPTKVVLLDELGFGLSAQGHADAETLIAAFHERGSAIVAVEQRQGRTLRIPHRTVVMDAGRIVEKAQPRFLVADQRRPTEDTPVATGGELHAAELCVRYGAMLALDDVAVDVHPGEIVAVAGQNGSGKSTLLDALGGTIPVHSGAVVLDGRNITAMAAHDRAELGLRRCLQGARLWPSLTVAETLALAARHDGVAPPGLLAALTRNVGAIADESLSQQAVDQLVEQFGLEQWRQFPIQRLSTGTRQVVALATLAAGRPRVALIDEPVAGVAAHERPAIARLIRDLADTSGAGIVLVEHDHEFVEAIADRVLTLSAGRMMTPTEPTGPSKPRRTDRASF